MSKVYSGAFIEQALVKVYSRGKCTIQDVVDDLFGWKQRRTLNLIDGFRPKSETFSNAVRIWSSDTMPDDDSGDLILNPSEELTAAKIQLEGERAKLVALNKENAKLEKRIADGIAGTVGVRGTVLEGAKVFTVLNSAGVAAMLAMTQALIVKDSFGPFKWFAIAILSSFLVGAISACLTFFVHSESALIALIEDKPAPAIVGVLWCIKASTFFFILGAVLMVCGLAVGY